jgi:sigma-B regulation protein RsbU (phosphoserine phosphatase)
MAMGAVAAVDVTQEWELASNLQERFMQASAAGPETLTYSAQCRQKRALGGDSFDFLPMPGGRVALAIADASGKGLAAALMISNVQSSLRTAAAFLPDCAGAVVQAVNRQVYTSSPEDRYATLFYGVLDERTLMLEYVNAGHNPPMVVSQDGSVTWLEAGGPPVGVFADSAYAAGVAQLHSGDLIVAYTDGVVEATDSRGREWGVDGLLAALKSLSYCAPDAIVESAFAALGDFAADGQTDDATLLVARVNWPPDTSASARI